jgi:hypothetical protein
MAFPGTLNIDYATPYETSTTQLPYQVGQKAESPDGRLYRYTKMGATLGVANKLYQSSLPVANWISQTHTVALAVGDTELSFDDGGTAFTVNQMENGNVLVEHTDDLGHLYCIKSNVVTAATETIMQLQDGVTIQVAVAVAAGNELTATLNPWMQILIQPSVSTALCIGVPPVVIAANAFGWVCTHGPASVLIDGSTAILVDNAVRMSKDDDGAVELHDETAAQAEYQEIGAAMTGSPPDTEFGTIFLKIE